MKRACLQQNTNTYEQNHASSIRPLKINFVRMKKTIKKQAEIKTDKWTGYMPLKKEFKNLTQISSGKKGKTFRNYTGRLWDLKDG
mgnify:FL=1